MLHIDWAENGEIQIPSEVQSAFYGGRMHYNLHTGYKYSKDDAGGFVSLSLYNNHKAEAIFTALDPTISELVSNGKEEIFSFLFVDPSFMCYPLAQLCNELET